MAKQVIQADLTWTGKHFEKDVLVALSDDGLIESVGTSEATPTNQLKGKALLPGMINAHSHAFQRGLRGRGETFPQGAGNFWTWRQAMYSLVETITEQQIYDLSAQAFREMLTAGITTVGEFHYLHHDASCAGYKFDEVVLNAASDVGIRIVLLNVFYKTGGFGQPLENAQERFGSTTLDKFWEQMDRLETTIDKSTQSLGVVAHSIRAADIDDIAALHEEAKKRKHVFHMHIEEQRKEIEDCIKHYSKRPMQLLNEKLQIDDAFTAVHCTHTNPDDMDEFLAAGGNVCICPLTEANLGDGIADIPGNLNSNGRICLGTDSNARISLIEEMRWMEYVQRLKREKRGVCLDENGNCAIELWKMATTNGANSLAIHAGQIEAGRLADFVAVDLDHQSLAGFSDETLLDAIIFGSSDSVVARTCVNGKWF
ncbi:MAG: formimidoylglutamate deiminase [Planctomycetes bacterium]|nr:formimidoylglutamate deiminase [Planctomycetota bacterium]